MENKVGGNLPTEVELDALLATITGAVEELKKFCVMLQAEERKFTVKPLKGGEDMVQKAHGLAARDGVEVKCHKEGRRQQACGGQTDSEGSLSGCDKSRALP